MIGEEDARMSAEQENDEVEEVNTGHNHPVEAICDPDCPQYSSWNVVKEIIDGASKVENEKVGSSYRPLLAPKVQPRTLSLAEAAEYSRALFAQAGVDVSTVTLSERKGGIDVRKVVAGPQQAYTKHQERVIKSLANARDTYAERSAVYKDNYKIVGRVMSALFPDGAPRLHDEMDYNRWHIFELMIVKITRYVNNFDLGHKDSLADLQVYTAILGAIDDELREQLEHYTSSEGN